MRDIYEIITDAVKDAVFRLYNSEINETQVQIQKTLKEFEGSVTLVVFPLLKISRKSPEITAEEIGNYLISENVELAQFNVVKGFLNLTLSDVYRIQYIKFIYRNRTYGYKSKNDKSKRIVIEFSSPNTNKPLHLGHIRNNLLGWSVSKILEANGHEVIKVNLVNDRGIHICKSMLAWLEKADGKTPESENMKGDHFVGDYYVTFDKEYQKQISDLTENGITKDEAKDKAEWIVKARDMLQKWENGDNEVRALWKRMNDWVYEGFDVTYKILGISFDKTYYESETYLKGKDVILKALNEQKISKKNDGTVYIDLTDKGLDEKILLRSDGTALYMTQDIGTAIIRYDDFSFDESVYVVGNEQDYHFKVLKIILSELSYQWAQNISHLSYGMVELPKGMGRMKSREGTVVDADELIEEMVITAAEKSDELGKLEGLSEHEKKETFDKIALGALKFFILKVDAKKNMVFNPEESIDFNGHTGPFVQYTFVRIKSMLEKALTENFLISDNYSEKLSLEPSEINLTDKLFEFEKIVEEAGGKRNPSVIANYVYELAKDYNRFYHEVPVLKEENSDKKQFRLSVSEKTADIIRNSLDMLGIGVPEKM